MTPTDPHERWRTRSTAAAFRHAGEGILYSLRTQRHVPHYFAVIFLVLISGMYLRLSRIELLFVLSAIMFVLIAEMFNTAVETIVDRLCPEYDRSAKVAKDTACAAVFVACCYAVAVLLIVFFNGDRMEDMALGSFREHPIAPVETWVGGLILLAFMVAMIKWRGRRGTLMRGGVISGHSAFAFFMATWLAFVIEPPSWSIVGFALAILVAQSRVDGRIHSVTEVAMGSVFGLGTALAVQYLGGLLA
jgi:diacylglycerol kinase (ATP)